MVLIVGVVSYIKSYQLPEGYTRSHHSYEDMLEFAEKIDPDATVSETYIVQSQNDHQAIHEWPATINGIECHVASTPEMFPSSRGSASMQTGYCMDTDYDQIVLGIVLENYPELGEIYEQRYSYQAGMGINWHSRSPVRSTVNLDSIDEDTFEMLWKSYVNASQEFASYNPTRGYNLTIKLSSGVSAYIENTSDEQYQIAKEKLFS